MSARFSAVPRAAIDDDNLTHLDLLVLMALGCHTDEAGWCWPSQATLAKKARLSRNSVTASIRNLVKFGYVEVFKPENGDLSKIRYRVILDTARAPAENVTQEVAPLANQTGKPLPAKEASLARPVGKLARTANKACPPDGHKQEPTNYLNERDKGAAALFEEIWGAWSRKLKAGGNVGRGAGKAKTADIFKSKAAKTDPAVIRSSALAFLARTEPKFVPGLSVYLNQERYDTGDKVVAIQPTALTREEKLYAFEAMGRWDADWGPRPVKQEALL